MMSSCQNKIESVKIHHVLRQINTTHPDWHYLFFKCNSLQPTQNSHFYWCCSSDTWDGEGQRTEKQSVQKYCNIKGQRDCSMRGRGKSPDNWHSFKNQTNRKLAFPMTSPEITLCFRETVRRHHLYFTGISKLTEQKRGDFPLIWCISTTWNSSPSGKHLNRNLSGLSIETRSKCCFSAWISS